jgi:hypothetical protein
MISLLNSLPAGALWGLAALVVLGIFLVLCKEPISARVRAVRKSEESGAFTLMLANLALIVWKALSVPFYLFLFGFPIVFFFFSVLPILDITKENKLTGQDIMVYGEQRDAVALVSPPVDKSLPVPSPLLVKADANKLRSRFNDKEWVGVLTWARLLAGEKYGLDFRRLTDDQVAHIAWRDLKRYHGTTDADLLRIEKTIEKAVPDAATRARLLEWGRTRIRQVDTEATVLRFTRLPQLDWFAWWTVYAEYCPTGEGLAERKKFLIERLGGERRFGRDVWKSLLDFGKDTYDSQPSFNQFLPAGERAYMLAAVSRMVGLDEAGRKMYELERPGASNEAYKILPTGKDYSVLFLLMHVFYPNDDLAYMQFGTGWGGEHSLFALGSGQFSPALLVSGLVLVLWALLVQRSMRRVTITGFGRLLGLRGNPAFERLSKVAFNPWLQLLSLAVVIPLTWAFARMFMEDFYVLYFRSEINLILAVLYSALIGAALCEAIANILALLCIRFGLDPERVFVDNLIAAGLSIAVLLYFQNSWVSIGSGLALGLVTGVALKVIGRKAGAEAATAVADAPRPPPRPVRPSQKKDIPPPARPKRPPDDE